MADSDENEPRIEETNTATISGFGIQGCLRKTLLTAQCNYHQVIAHGNRQSDQNPTHYYSVERSSGRSRGFGYVTFKSADDAKKALDSEHTLGGRTLEVKVATPKEEMRAPSKKITQIFVARISPSVTEEMFRSYFGDFGKITDLYMPKVAYKLDGLLLQYATAAAISVRVSFRGKGENTNLHFCCYCCCCTSCCWLVAANGHKFCDV